MSRIQTALAALLCLALAPGVLASGTLTPQGSRDQAVKMLDHRVEVVINNGFARTEVGNTRRGSTQGSVMSCRFSPDRRVKRPRLYVHYFSPGCKLQISPTLQPAGAPSFLP